jgi:CO/xanthine dehydrogenase Mo-binding subunit
MTEMLKKEFSRKTFVKGGGALVVGFSLGGVALAGRAQAVDSPYASNPIDHFQVDSWIVINADDTASIKSGSIHQGTWSTTGILMIAAEELDMDFSQVVHVQADTAMNPDSGPKLASNTIVYGAGRGVRAAAATARQALLGLASTQLGVPASSLSVSKGVVSGGGRSATYGELLGGKLFNVRMPASYNMQDTSNIRFSGGLQAGQSPAKPVSQYKVVGTSPPEIDIPGIVTGALTYIQHVRVPGMVHGRWVRPPGQPVYGFAAQIVSVDESSIKHIRGARVVRKNNFLGVVAPEEYQAVQAAAQLKVKWATPPKALPGGGNEFDKMRALDSAGRTVQTATVVGNPDGALASAAQVVKQSYGWPTNVHTPIGASCAVADVTPQGARIFSGTQGEYKTRETVASVIGLPLNKVRVTAVAMGGCNGNGMQYRDAAAAAALMSQLAGAPVRVHFMRWDEIGWDNTAPGTLLDLRAGIDAKGTLVGFDSALFYPQYETEIVEHVAMLVGTPPVPTSVAGTAVPLAIYNVPNSRALLKSLPLKDNWISADWFRHGSRIPVVWGTEQAVDDLARSVGMDPVAFRKQNVSPAARDSLLAVLDAVTKAANWQPKVPASKLSNANVVTGRGVAWYGLAANDASMKVAAIADVSVNKQTGKVTVKHVYQAFSAGLLVYPGGVASQNDGGIVQVLSRLLVEQLRTSQTNVTSSDFVSYPALRFKDSPKVTSILLQRSDVPPQGVGQEVTDVAAAAVANAFFDATGVRMRTAPMTPARVRAVLKAGGSGGVGVK